MRQEVGSRGAGECALWTKFCTERFDLVRMIEMEGEVTRMSPRRTVPKCGPGRVSRPPDIPRMGIAGTFTNRGGR